MGEDLWQKYLKRKNKIMKKTWIISEWVVVFGVGELLLFPLDNPWVCVPLSFLVVVIGYLVSNLLPYNMFGDKRD
ncbi:hypothetical protein N9064_00525 [bacterium]|nr:hypothetical protein [bacterium]